MIENTETVSKKRRGRPRLYDDEFADILRKSHPGKTERSIQDLSRFHDAMACLKTDFPWIIDQDKMRKGERNACKHGLVAELGRIDDWDEMREVAKLICQIKPKTTRQAVYIVRRGRLEQSGEGNASDLADKIINTIDEYQKRFPKTTLRMVFAALEDTRDAAERVEEQQQ